MIYAVAFALALVEEPTGAVIRNQQRWNEMRAGVHLPANYSTGYTAVSALPKEFSWGNVNGETYLTTMRNQHSTVTGISFVPRPISRVVC